MRKYFREPKDFESTFWLSQITQAYGIKYGAEGWRREMPRSMGCVYWQYNDCWPCTSWSSVDYFGRWKALQYLARRFYAPVLVSGVEDAKAGKVDVFVTSDRLSDCQGKLTWTVTDVAGKTLASGSSSVDIPARTSRVSQSLSLREALQSPAPRICWSGSRLDVDGRTESENLVTLAYPASSIYSTRVCRPTYPSATADTRSPCMPRIRLCGRGWNSTARTLAFPITSFT